MYKEEYLMTVQCEEIFSWKNGVAFVYLLFFLHVERMLLPCYSTVVILHRDMINRLLEENKYEGKSESNFKNTFIFGNIHERI
jgi:hypothetical protein